MTNLSLNAFLQLSKFDFWRLCDELSVFQAALLTIGEDPSAEGMEHLETWSSHQRPRGYDAAKTAIGNALRSQTIDGTLVLQQREDLDGKLVPSQSIDLHQSRVQVASLKVWLARRGLTTGFFFSDEPDVPGYLDPEHPKYAPKLTAAVRAWIDATAAPSAGKSPKQIIIKWLREHAAEFQLTDDEGKVNEQGIEEIAKVANWQPGGGAPRTPGG